MLLRLACCTVNASFIPVTRIIFPLVQEFNSLYMRYSDSSATSLLLFPWIFEFFTPTTQPHSPIATV